MILALAALCLVACKQDVSKSTGNPEIDATQSWYSTCISGKSGEHFHSEIGLGAGEFGEVSVASEAPLVVGFVVEKGYEISKGHGTIYMGTADAPRAIGGSPGACREFEATGGVVRVRLENASRIPTRIAIYTKPRT